MKKIDWHYPRKELAQRYLESLYSGPLNKITLLDVRRTGKTTFLLNDMFDVALENGFVPLYVNLWQNPDDPTQSIIDAFDLVINANDIDVSVSRSRELNLKKVEVGNSMFGKATFESDPVSVVSSTPQQLQQISTLVRQVISAYGDKVLIMIDEIQHLASNDCFLPLQQNLRTLFDTHDELNILFAGSSRAGVAAMFGDSDKPFYASSSMISLPRLGDDFVHHVQDALKSAFRVNYSFDELIDFYHSVEKTPFWLMKLVQRAGETREPLVDLVSFVQEQIIQDGDFESLAKRVDILDKQLLLSIYQGNTSLYSDDALTRLGEASGLQLTASKVQARVKKLVKLKLLSVYGRKYFLESPGFMKYLGLSNAVEKH